MADDTLRITRRDGRFADAALGQGPALRLTRRDGRFADFSFQSGAVRVTARDGRFADLQYSSTPHQVHAMLQAGAPCAKCGATVAACTCGWLACGHGASGDGCPNAKW